MIIVMLLIGAALYAFLLTLAIALAQAAKRSDELLEGQTRSVANHYPAMVHHWTPEQDERLAA